LLLSPPHPRKCVFLMFLLDLSNSTCLCRNSKSESKSETGRQPERLLTVTQIKSFRTLPDLGGMIYPDSPTAEPWTTLGIVPVSVTVPLFRGLWPSSSAPLPSVFTGGGVSRSALARVGYNG